ncbi:MAG: PQQ-dependent sugar dehydrogenase [Bacteroidota bacterium]
MKMKVSNLLLVVVVLGTISCGDDDATPQSQTNNEDPVATAIALVNAFPALSFNQPLDLQAPNDGTDRIFVVEKGGRIQVFPNDGDVADFSTFLDISANLSTASEQGLLGLAFHPDFSLNGQFYVHYSPNTATSRIARFTADPGANTIDVATEQILIDIPQPETNHNGGQLAFGPDGLLYIAIGDGGGAGDPDNHAQNRSNLLGTILRIDVDNPSNGLNYGIPSTNPFLGNSNIREEIFAYGLRNPWRMSFDLQTGALWTGDVGQGALEEINIIASGGNFGWKLFEGTSCFSGDCDTAGLVAPIFEYGRNNGDLSITGGYVYRGNNLPALQGKYVYGDFVSGRIWTLDTDGSNNQLLSSSGLSIASFGTDSNQELYVCAFFDGAIYTFREVPTN